MEHKDRQYRGELIRGCQCERAQRGLRWIVQTYHEPTGIPWACSECSHYYTLTLAREMIDLGKAAGAAGA